MSTTYEGPCGIEIVSHGDKTDIIQGSDSVMLSDPKDVADLIDVLIQLLSDKVGEADK